MSRSLLDIEDITVAYGKIEALRGVSLSAQAGRVTSVLGPNGAGKTTLLRAIAGIARVTRGSIRYGGADITNGNVERLVREGILYQPESRELFSTMSVRENLMSGVRAGDAGVDERMELVTRAFPLLRERIDQRTATMSGGEQQMVAIGRAFMANPTLLLLDEPSLGLAPAMVRSTFEQLQFLQEQVSLTVVLAEQNTRMSLEIADEVYVLSNGGVADHRAASELTEQEVLSSYFGATGTSGGTTAGNHR